MKTAFFPNIFLNTVLIDVFLMSSNTRLTILYEGSVFKGVTYDFNKILPLQLKTILEEIIPYNLNDLKNYEQKFTGRVEYLFHVNKDRYTFISDEDYYKSFIILKNQNP